MIIGFDGSRINTNQRTGTENYSYELLRHMAALRGAQHQIRVYSRASLPAEIQNLDIDPCVIPAKRLWTQAGLALEIIKRQPDVLFIPAHTLPVLHRPSLRSVVTIHDLGAEYLPQFHTFPGKLYLNRSTEYAARFASMLIAVSEFTKRDLTNRLGVPSSKIRVVYEGVDTSHHQCPPTGMVDHTLQRFGITKPYLLFVGTVQPRKNLARLIEAISLMKNKQIKLVIAGKKGWLSDDIYQAPSKYLVNHRIHFLGYTSHLDTACLYTGATATVLPSLFEGFGLPLLESMAYGTPVIAANSTSLPEVVGSAGLLVDPLDSQSMADGMDQLVHDIVLQTQLRQAGLERVKQFSWQKAASETLSVLEEVAHV
jgi:glycosyltransferase involved in cell wall biosynthesis